MTAWNLGAENRRSWIFPSEPGRHGSLGGLDSGEMGAGAGWPERKVTMLGHGGHRRGGEAPPGHRMEGCRDEDEVERGREKTPGRWMNFGFSLGLGEHGLGSGELSDLSTFYKEVPGAVGGIVTPAGKSRSPSKMPSRRESGEGASQDPPQGPESWLQSPRTPGTAG